MRDLVITLVIFGSLPLILWRPHIGVLMWTWLAFMNPHRMTWGFAYDMPFAHVVALATLVSVLVTREPKKLPWTRETALLLLFVGWMSVTTVFAAYPEYAWPQLEKVAKILLMVFVTMMVMRTKERINLLVWVMALSLAFYGIKGGVFTLASGGVYHVWGPTGSFIEGNNEMALALVMTIPLLRYLQLTVNRAWVRHGMTLAMILTALAVVGSQSRGAFLGIIAMGAFFWLKSSGKFFTGSIGALAVVLVLAVMPQQWFDRMSSITEYEQDSSALGRLNAWQMAIKLAQYRPLGGGFETFRAEMFAAYSPEPARVHDAHSIYFEVLGEHGFVGLVLFLLLGFMTWRSASAIIRHCRGDPEKRWAADLAAMIQVSLVGYASAGAFLGLAYFDYYYTLVAVVVLCKQLLLTQPAAARPVASPIADTASAQRAG
jgi:probable O-glycosylation ligase (exosortase A-associated)